MKYLEEFRNSAASLRLAGRIKDVASRLAMSHERICIMEVCGSHTMAIGRYGIRSLMPPNIDLISGPGCPVCVTDSGYIDAAIELARRGAIICTFGDMLRVPGSAGSLATARSEGAHINICYSPAEAIEVASVNPRSEVVFLGIGFETTIGPVLSLIRHSQESGLKNVSILTAFKTVPPALAALASSKDVQVDAFLGPAHVSAVIGAEAYEQIVDQFRRPVVIAGFEPLDILYGILGILVQIEEGAVRVENQYNRVVKPGGNKVIQEMIDRHLVEVDAGWRGIGIIPKSGLSLRRDFAEFDAERKLGVQIVEGRTNPSCRCGEVLKGAIKPPECPLFGKVCSIQHPLGACMVSSEGSCAAWFRYAEAKGPL